MISLTNTLWHLWTISGLILVIFNPLISSLFISKSCLALSREKYCVPIRGPIIRYDVKSGVWFLRKEMASVIYWGILISISGRTKCSGIFSEFSIRCVCRTKSCFSTSFLLIISLVSSLFFPKSFLKTPSSFCILSDGFFSSSKVTANHFCNKALWTRA